MPLLATVAEIRERELWKRPSALYFTREPEGRGLGVGGGTGQFPPLAITEMKHWILCLWRGSEEVLGHPTQPFLTQMGEELQLLSPPS